MKKKIAINCLKWLPVAASVLALMHVAHLIGGVDTPVFEVIEVIIGFTIIIEFSKSMGFCLKHRLMVYYAGLVTACVYLQRHIGFGQFRDELRLIVLWIGIVLFVYVIIDMVWTKIRKN